MVVTNRGYATLQKVLDMFNAKTEFGIYETNKGTFILIKGSVHDTVSIFRPNKHRLPYNIVEGKKITQCRKIFNSKTDSKDLISLAIGGNQIMTYEPYSYSY